MEFGIDLSLTFRNMFELSMADRLLALDERLDERLANPQAVRRIGTVPR